jgi:hypothetical protein
MVPFDCWFTWAEIQGQPMKGACRQLPVQPAPLLGTMIGISPIADLPVGNHDSP